MKSYTRGKSGKHAKHKRCKSYLIFPTPTIFAAARLSVNHITRESFSAHHKRSKCNSIAYNSLHVELFIRSFSHCMAYIFLIQCYVSTTASTAGVRIDKTVRDGTVEIISNIALDKIIIPKLHYINAILI